MSFVFWISVGLVMYTYAGYPLWLGLRSRLWPLAVRKASSLPMVSIVAAVRNESAALPRKLANLLALDYPPDRCEIVIVSDGSTDGTNEILTSNAGDRLRTVICTKHVGKAEALNRGIAAAHGEVVVFTDARQWVEPDALRHLVANLADPAVGCVSGELILGDPDKEGLAGAGLYWKMEKRIRQWESTSGSVVGATGALYAIRRELIEPIPEGTILDDVYLPMVVARQGKRIVFEPRAKVWDCPPAATHVEFHRKVRTLTGNYQLLRLAPWLLTRWNPMRFAFFSHKLLRLFVPFALAGAFVSSIFLSGNFYHFAAVAQGMFYALALVSIVPARLGRVSRIANIAMAFLVLNAAAVVALVNFLTGRKPAWA